MSAPKYNYIGPKVDARHPDFEEQQIVWCRCRDAVKGEDAIKGRGTEYLPRLSAQDEEDYQTYKLRAMFYNATSRTVEGLVGAIFRRPPNVEVPDDTKKLMDIRVGIDGAKFSVFGQRMVREVLTTNRVGVLVDAANTRDSSARPYAVIYEAENILNWREEWIGDQKMLTLVVLEEKVDSPTSEFEYDCKYLYRVLDLVLMEDDTYAYRQRVFEKSMVPKEGEVTITFNLISNVFPTMKGGKFFDHIPFRFTTEEGESSKLMSPPIVDLVSVNISHYRNSADLEYGRHYTALPTPWAAGFKFDAGQQLTIGPTKAWVSDEPTAHCGLLEFTGEGLAALTAGLQEKERQMAVLGARILQDGKKEAESADAVMLRNSGEQNTLMSIVIAVSDTMKWMLQQFGMFLGETEEVTVELNKDFDTSGMPAGMLISLLQALQNGAISYDVFFWNMKRGEMYPEGMTIEDERNKIEEGPPMPPLGALEQAGSGVPLPGGANRNANTAISGKK